MPEAKTQQQNNTQTPASSYEQKVLDIARVARMVSGGRRFNFRAVVAVGDRNGKVGVGKASGNDVPIAIDKATKKAEKNTIKVPITPKGTIPYETKGKYSGSEILLKPSRSGRGIIAGGAVRVICDLAGYEDISGKIVSRSANKLNNANATLTALQNIRYTPPTAEEKPKDKDQNNSEKAKTTKNKTKEGETNSKS